MISSYSIKTKKLKKRQVLDIIELKDQHWKFGLKSQLLFFFFVLTSINLNFLFCLFFKDWPNKLPPPKIKIFNNQKPF